MRLISRRAVALAVFAGAASEGAAIGLLATATWLIVRAAGHPPLAALAVGIAGVRAFALLRGTLRYAERLAGHDAALRSLAGLRARVYAALAGLPPDRLRRRHSGELLSTVVADVDAVTDLVVRSLVPAGSAALVAAGGIAAVSLASPVAGAVVAGGLLLCAVLAIALRTDDVPRAALATATVDLLDGAADLAVAGATTAALGTAQAAGDRLAAAERRAPAYGATAAVLLGSGLTAVAVLALSHSAVLTLATLALFEVCGPLPAAARNWRTARATLRRLGDLPADIPDRPTRPAQGAVELTGVGVSYGLHDVTLQVPAGHRLAVVGASGSGKSTLLAAIAGLTPHAGEIRIGGVPLAEVDLPATVAGVLADAHVFHASIAENVALADPDAPAERVWSALRRAALADWVTTLPDGVATVVGEDAALLSGGQRQRLLLARALFADPPVLLLDEPTEGVDAATADALQRELLDATAGRTTVLVTHRLTGLDAVDEVVVLDAGRIVDRGTHAELLTRPGPYRDLFGAAVLTTRI